MKRVIALTATLLAGCSLLVSLNDLGGADASTDATPDITSEATTDALGDAAVMCDPQKPFAIVSPMAELNTVAPDNHATLSPDELHIWFSSSRDSDAGKRDIYHAKRSQRTDAFSAPQIVAELSSSMDEGQPSISADLDTIVFARQSSQWDMLVAVRNNPSQPFGTPGSLVAINTGAVEWTPSLTPDETFLYFASDRDGGNNTNLWRWQFNSASSPTPIDELNTTGNDDERPCISSDQLWIYWSSTRTDLGSKGGSDVFVAHRTDTSAAFGGLAQVAEVTTKFDENPDWLSPDLCRLYMHSNRGSGIGGDDLYVAVRVP